MEHGYPLVRREACACGRVIQAPWNASPSLVRIIVMEHQGTSEHRRWRRDAARS